MVRRSRLGLDRWRLTPDLVLEPSTYICLEEGKTGDAEMASLTCRFGTGPGGGECGRPSAFRAPLIALCLLPLLPSSAAATWSLIRGALVAQALGHPAAMREGIRLLRAGVTPDSALREHRGDRSAADVLVQGSLLAGPEVLDRTLTAVQQARAAGKPMDEVLMAGLSAGSEAGGDSRCGAQRATAAFLAVAECGGAARVAPCVVAAERRARAAPHVGNGEARLDQIVCGEVSPRR
jgi:hypothetical protein